MPMLSNEQIVDTYFTKGSLWKYDTSSDEVKGVSYYIVLGVDVSYVNTMLIRTKGNKIRSVANVYFNIGFFIEKLTYVDDDCDFLNRSEIDINIAVKLL